MPETPRLDPDPCQVRLKYRGECIVARVPKHQRVPAIPCLRETIQHFCQLPNLGDAQVSFCMCVIGQRVITLQHAYIALLPTGKFEQLTGGYRAVK